MTTYAIRHLYEFVFNLFANQMFSNTDVSLELIKRVFHIMKEESFHSGSSSQNQFQSVH